MLDYRCLIATFNNHRDRSGRNKPRGENGEAASYGSYMNPESGFLGGPSDSHDTDQVVPSPV